MKKSISYQEFLEQKDAFKASNPNNRTVNHFVTSILLNSIPMDWDAIFKGEAFNSKKLKKIMDEYNINTIADFLYNTQDIELNSKAIGFINEFRIFLQYSLGAKFKQNYTDDRLDSFLNNVINILYMPEEQLQKISSDIEFVFNRVNPAFLLDPEDPTKPLIKDTRTRNALLNGQIFTLEDLMRMSRIDLLKLPNFGKKSLAVLDEVIPKFLNHYFGAGIVTQAYGYEDPVQSVLDALTEARTNPKPKAEIAQEENKTPTPLKVEFNLAHFQNSYCVESEKIFHLVVPFGQAILDVRVKTKPSSTNQKAFTLAVCNRSAVTSDEKGKAARQILSLTHPPVLVQVERRGSNFTLTANQLG